MSVLSFVCFFRILDMYVYIFLLGRMFIPSTDSKGSLYSQKLNSNYS